MRAVKYIVVHTAGAYDFKRKRVVHQSIQAIRDYHVNHNGWNDIGYHAYVEQDGTLMIGRLEEHVGSHAQGFNHHSLGICCSGHGDFEAFNSAQLTTLKLRCARWCRLYHVPVEHVIGHRETDDHGGPPVVKTCPGVMVDMDAIRADVRELLRMTAV